MDEDVGEQGRVAREGVEGKIKMCHIGAVTHSSGGSLSVLVASGCKASESDEHGTALAEGTDEEELSSADLLDEEEGREGEDGVDDGQNSSKNERKLGREVDVLFEKNGRVVDDGVATTELLEELGRSSDESSSHVLLLAVLEQILGGSLGLGLGDDRVGHEVSLGDGNRVVDGSSGETSDNSRSLGVVAVLHEPSRRFGKDGDSAHHNEREQDLQGHGESPRDGTLHVRIGRRRRRVSKIDVT